MKNICRYLTTILARSKIFQICFYPMEGLHKYIYNSISFVRSKINYATVNLALVFTTLPHLLGRYKWKIVCTAFVNSHTYCAKSALQYRDSRRFLCIFQKASPLKFTFSESWHIDVKQPIRFYLKNTFHLYTYPKL